jgi:hypothetical protein
MAKDIEPEKILAAPFRNFLVKVLTMLQALIREGVPVDRGQARQSISTRVSAAKIPTKGKVFSRLARVRHLNYGTGSLTVNAGATSDWTFPEGKELNTWAKRHGFVTPKGSEWTGGDIVSAIIRKRGGLYPRGFFEDGFNRGRVHVAKFLDELAREINARLTG